jgi:hypothetical protein
MARGRHDRARIEALLARRERRGLTLAELSEWVSKTRAAPRWQVGMELRVHDGALPKRIEER